jgi:phosphoglycolate phosphatase
MLTERFDFVLLDFDGTIAHTDPLIEKTFVGICQDLGLKAPSHKTMSKFLGNDPTNFLPATVRKTAGLEYLSNKFWEKYFNNILKHSDSITFIPGVLDLVEHIHSEGIPMGIVTNKRGYIARKELDILVGKCEKKLHVEFCIGAGEGWKHKPEPDLLVEGRRRLAPGSSKGLIIGDSGADVGAAIASGLKSCLYIPPVKNETFPDKIRSQATYVVNNMLDAIEFVKGSGREIHRRVEEICR